MLARRRWPCGSIAWTVALAATVWEPCSSPAYGPASGSAFLTSTIEPFGNRARQSREHRSRVREVANYANQTFPMTRKV